MTRSSLSTFLFIAALLASVPGCAQPDSDSGDTAGIQSLGGEASAEEKSIIGITIEVGIAAPKTPSR